MYKAKLLGNAQADGDNGILKNATIAMTLKYLMIVTWKCFTEFSTKIH